MQRILALALLFVPRASTGVATAVDSCTSTQTAAAVARSAEELCAGIPVEQALLSVQLHPTTAEELGGVLRGHSFQIVQVKGEPKKRFKMVTGCPI
eukprot:SAG31_NODE_2071_length_6515_cov_2.490804_4_plen_96_part_00